MSAVVGVLFSVVLGLQQPGVALAVDDLTRVRELYALASYEEALTRLDAAGSRVDPERAAEYRALCLLGLNRTAEAGLTIERLIVERPSYEMAEADVPPRLYALFRDARQRAVPTAARAQYTAAKAAFDAGSFEQAADHFRAVLVHLADETLLAQVDGLRDLRTLSGGFLNLAEAELRRRDVVENQPPAQPPSVVASTSVASMRMASTPAAAPARMPDAPIADEGDRSASAGTVYSESDAAVDPPTELSRRLPAWNPPPALARMEFRGVLEVVIDERGAVTTASLSSPVHPAYDDALLEAASRWRFRPATREGVPVPYRKRFEIVLNRR